MADTEMRMSDGCTNKKGEGERERQRQRQRGRERQIASLASKEAMMPPSRHEPRLSLIAGRDRSITHSLTRDGQECCCLPAIHSFIHSLMEDYPSSIIAVANSPTRNPQHSRTHALASQPSRQTGRQTDR
eukprot:GHVU01204333.1.p1 GENE.GHVU01204333.1~~GHVU01204333.1.p1  ORF type:complete len:130 (-),score=6.17 GHVU01204333.1:107-496(-)